MLPSKSHVVCVYPMGIIRAHVILPSELAAEIDKITGPRGRTAFLIESAEKEVRRLKMLAFLDDKDPVWKSEAHSGILEKGAAAWTHNQRQQSSTRQLRVEAWAEENNL